MAAMGSEDDEATGSVFGGEAVVDDALVCFVDALDDDVVKLGDSGFGTGRFRAGLVWRFLAVHVGARWWW